MRSQWLAWAMACAGCSASYDRASVRADAGTGGHEGATESAPLDQGAAADAGAAPADGAFADSGPAVGADGDAAVASDAGEAAADRPARAADAGSLDCSEDSSPTDAPMHLRCTGLYDDWAAQRIAPGNTEFKPAVPLWSDGAQKRRWVFLPPGSPIDTSDMNDWTFPVNTKLWKEFTFNGKHVETRFFWKVGPGTWTRTTYRWSEDQSDATRFEVGYRDADAGPSGYEIPAVGQCDDCHGGRKDRVLGFEAINLGLPGATGVTLASLVADGRLTSPPAVTSLAIPDDATGKAAAALGYLHTNCGITCHNPNPTAFCRSAGMHLKLPYEQIASGTVHVSDLDAYTTTVGVPAPFADVVPGAGADLSRVSPGDLAHSAIALLMGRRDPTGSGFQMPPIDTHIPDPDGLATVTAWIAALAP